MRIMRFFFWVAAACICAHASEIAVFNSPGRLTGMVYGGDELAVTANLGAPLPGWVKFTGLEKSERTEVTRAGGATTWFGIIGPVENQHAGFRQTVRENGGKVRIEIEVRTEDTLETASDNPKVLFTAFAGGESGQRALTLHVANLGAEREVTLQGLPSEVHELRAVRTSETEDFLELAPVKPESGSVVLRMPARSLLTLTNYVGTAR